MTRIVKVCGGKYVLRSVFHRGESVLRYVTDRKNISVYDLEVKNQKSLKAFSNLERQKPTNKFSKQIPEKVLVSMVKIALVASGYVNFNSKAT